MKKALPANYNRQTAYSLADAAALLPQLSTSKFTGGVDIDVVLTATEKQKKESVKGSFTLTNNFGNSAKVIVFAEGEDAKTAKAAGADEVGLEDLVKQVEEGKVDFDVVIATPTVMPKIAKLGKVLGPKGLMPNPANETVTKDLEKSIANYKSGKRNFKMNEQGAIKTKVAMVDMTPEQITQNVMDFMKAVYPIVRKFNAQPFKKIIVSPTMGAPVKLDVNAVMAELA